MDARPNHATSRSAQRYILALAMSALVGCSGGGGTTTALPQTQAPAQTLAAAGTMPPSTGTIATGYIECDTLAHTAAGNNCDGYANFTPATAPAFGGASTFTAIAAGAGGAPIVQELSNGGAMSFANGTYRVVEAASDGAPVVTITGGPWSTPGSAFSTASGSYGNMFSVACARVGIATLVLQMVANGNAQTLPLAATAFGANSTSVNCSSSASIPVE